MVKCENWYGREIVKMQNCETSSGNGEVIDKARASLGESAKTHTGPNRPVGDVLRESTHDPTNDRIKDSPIRWMIGEFISWFADSPTERGADRTIESYVGRRVSRFAGHVFRLIDDSMGVD